MYLISPFQPYESIHDIGCLELKQYLTIQLGILTSLQSKDRAGFAERIRLGPNIDKTIKLSFHQVLLCNAETSVAGILGSRRPFFSYLMKKIDVIQPESSFITIYICRLGDMGNGTRRGQN